MRDLASRLREIVRRETPVAPRALVRELTYVPDPDLREPFEGIAERLGGTPVDGHGSCVAIDSVTPADRSHGRKRLEDCVPAPEARPALFDPRLAQCADWTRRVVFFDIETTGLSGGAGTLAFLIGCGWFEPDGFRTRQFFLSAPSGERAALDALAEVLSDASLIVTYNGRTFDLPFVEMRWAYHRVAPPTDGLPHFDMLPAARRLWGEREDDGSGLDQGCSLATLERAVLGFHRQGDVPGFEIPARYFQFLRTGDPDAVSGVLEHNRHDLVSLAVLMAHALWLAREGPDACRTAEERVALGRVYERSGDLDAAERAFTMGAACADRVLRQQATARLAMLLSRRRRHDAAATAWQRVLDLESPVRALSRVERVAARALAVHHEHRAKDVATARAYADLLDRSVERPAERGDVQYRLARLDRKIEARKHRPFLS